MAFEAPAHPQTGSTQDAVGAEAVPIATLNGSWVRNDELSEDPIAQLTRLFEERSLIPRPTLEFTERLSERRRGVRVQADFERVLIENAAGERLDLLVDGLARRYTANRTTSANLNRGILEIVTAGADSAWLWLETYYRSGDRLVHVTESRSLTVPDLHFKTVYDHADGRPTPTGPVGMEQMPPTEPAAIRIVPPRRRHRELLTGEVEVQTLVIDPLVKTVDFLLDGKLVKQARKPPFKARIRLADPPREETIEVRAYRHGKAFAGADQIVPNRLESPFAVHIAELRSYPIEDGSTVSVTARISVPESAALASVEFYRSQHQVAAFDDPGWKEGRRQTDTIRVDTLVENAEPGDFVRVVARLADGRELEDAELLQPAEHSSEIDVQLVQLQILAVDRDGHPVSNLRPEDFEVRENGERRPVESLHASNDVPLALGIAIDSSESMRLVWRRLHTVVRTFLAGALDVHDRAFLVDFDDSVRLLQPLTGSKPLLAGRLNRLQALGGTALNDGLLFSLLQFRQEPGRRALVVVTDGDDQHSRSRAAQVSDFAEWMGVPIYFIAVGWDEPPRGLVRKLSRRTGGRMFRIHPSLPHSALTAEMQQVFHRINEDLRHQHILTYYSRLPLGEGIQPEVRSPTKRLTLKSVLPLYGIE